MLSVLETHPDLISDLVQQLLAEIVDQRWLRRTRGRVIEMRLRLEERDAVLRAFRSDTA